MTAKICKRGRQREPKARKYESRSFPLLRALHMLDHNKHLLILDPLHQRDILYKRTDISSTEQFLKRKSFHFMEIEQHPLPINPSSIIIALQASIDNLVKNWQKRQRWQLFFRCQQAQEDGRKRAPWRTHLANLLESTPVHIASLSLLLLDLIFTVRDLSSSLVSCNSSRHEKEKSAEEILFYHWGGVAILSLLGVKTVALVLALGQSFFRRPGRVVDGLVVIGALVLEMLARGEGGGLLVVVSLWRVVRVVESAFELSNETIQAHIEEIQNQFQSLRVQNRRLQEVINEKDQRIVELEEALARRGQSNTTRIHEIIHLSVERLS